MNRPLILGTIGGIIVIVALALTFYVDESGKPDTVAVLKNQSPKTAGAPVSDTAPIVAPVPGSPAPDVKSAAPSEGAVRPSFDVVRVNPQGDAVIAGRAAPNAEVVVRDGKKEVGKAKADSHGEWVMVPKQPLPEGSRELTLSAKSRDGAPTLSDRNVVIMVPEREKKAGSGPATAAPGSLAVLVPREGTGESIVLQRPGDAEQGGPAAGQQQAALSPEDVLKGGKPGSSKVPLSIDAVDYDDAGHATISGTAEPKAKLNVYIENKFAGAGSADKSGRWRLVPGGELKAGMHTLRVDEVADSGKVVARVATQFSRARPATAPGDKAVVFVEPGNSLWRIARRVYGTGLQYTVIYAANREQIRDPDLIYPGQVFFVPHVN